jgi:type IV secretory pathway TraG/TraD family ATPase VirD4
MLDLDTIGERNQGSLPMPVGIILDEFPTLGKLDSLVADVNLVRKRRISILVGAQTKGQFHLLYGAEGTQALFSGLATQIIYGGVTRIPQNSTAKPVAPQPPTPTWTIPTAICTSDHS